MFQHIEEENQFDFFKNDQGSKVANSFEYFLDLSQNQLADHLMRIETDRQTEIKNGQKTKAHLSQSDQIYKNSQCSTQSQENKRKSNKYHNFQKHLVNTLRKIICTEEFSAEKEVLKLMNGLWRCFDKSKKANKKLIGLTLGQIKKNDLKQWQQFGFQKLLKDSNNKIIRTAQKQLRLQVYKQIENIDLDNVIQQSRIQNKKEFKAYFFKFWKKIKNKKFCERFQSFQNILQGQFSESSD